MRAIVYSRLQKSRRLRNVRCPDAVLVVESRLPKVSRPPRPAPRSPTAAVRAANWVETTAWAEGPEVALPAEWVAAAPRVVPPRLVPPRIVPPRIALKRWPALLAAAAVFVSLAFLQL